MTRLEAVPLPFLSFQNDLMLKAPLKIKCYWGLARDPISLMVIFLRGKLSILSARFSQKKKQPLGQD